jgi:hypothetical protein
MVALATAYNARETEGGTTKQELLHFVEEVSTLAHMHTHTYCTCSFLWLKMSLKYTMHI